VLLYIGARVAVAMTLAFGNPPGEPPRFAGWDIALFVMAVTGILSEVDMRRAGAPFLMANLGLGVRERLTLALIAPAIGESCLIWWMVS
jgi:hypothetical protein